MKKLLFVVYCLLFITGTPVQAQQSLPALEIISPTDGVAYEDGQELKLFFRTENFTFVDFKNNREPFPGNSNAGHAHLWVVPAGFEGDLNHDAAKKILQDFRPEKFAVDGPGKYKVIVELTQNHHLAYDPPVRQEAIFTIGQPALSSEVGEAVFSGDSAYSVAAMGLIALIILLLILKAVLYYKKRRNKNKTGDALPLSEAGGNNTTQHSIPR